MGREVSVTMGPSGWSRGRAEVPLSVTSNVRTGAAAATPPGSRGIPAMETTTGEPRGVVVELMLMSQIRLLAGAGHRTRPVSNSVRKAPLLYAGIVSNGPRD